MRGMVDGMLYAVWEKQKKRETRNEQLGAINI